MGQYQYEAMTMTGARQTGFVEAKDDTEARVKIRAKQLKPMHLKLVQRAGNANKQKVEGVSFFSPKVNSKELQIFTRQFSVLINAGIPIIDALKILSDGTPDKLIKEAVYHIKTALETGKPLSEAMSKHPRVFDALYCNMIRAGEQAGILDVILNRLSIYSEKNEKIKNQVKSALTMPIIIVIAAFAVISGIIIFIIPKFQEMYAGSGKALPALTQVVVDISDAVRNHWLIILGSIAGAIYAAITYSTSEVGKVQLDKLTLRAPILGSVVQRAAVARLSRTMSTLLASGISMLEAIDIAAKTSGNVVIEKSLQDCKDAISNGKPFNQQLAKQRDIPQMVAQMVAIGEQTGALDTMLGKIADFYEDEVENAVKAMTTMIEPLMMVGLGGIIAFILVAMYLPVFQMGDTIGQ
jgi:type IV pilus assembly protein PilC